MKFDAKYYVKPHGYTFGIRSKPRSKRGLETGEGCIQMKVEHVVYSHTVYKEKPLPSLSLYICLVPFSLLLTFFYFLVDFLVMPDCYASLPPKLSEFSDIL